MLHAVDVACTFLALTNLTAWAAAVVVYHSSLQCSLQPYKTVAPPILVILQGYKILPSL